MKEDSSAKKSSISRPKDNRLSVGERKNVLHCASSVFKLYYIYLAASCVALLYLFHLKSGSFCRYRTLSDDIIGVLSPAMPSIGAVLKEARRLDPETMDSCFIAFFGAYTCFASCAVFLVFVLHLLRHFDLLKSDPIKGVGAELIVSSAVFFPPMISPGSPLGNPFMITFDRLGVFIPQVLIYSTAGTMFLAFTLLNLMLIVRGR